MTRLGSGPCRTPSPQSVCHTSGACGVLRVNDRGGIDDGQIFGVSHSGFNLDRFGPVWNSFRNWVRDNRPDDFNAIYSRGSHTPVYTAEAAELWKQLTDEFVTETTGS